MIHAAAEAEHWHRVAAGDLAFLGRDEARFTVVLTLATPAWGGTGRLSTR